MDFVLFSVINFFLRYGFISLKHFHHLSILSHNIIVFLDAETEILKKLPSRGDKARKVETKNEKKKRFFEI